MTLTHYKNGSEFPKIKNGTLRLYSMHFCPYAERARLILLAKKIPHEIVNINLHNKPDWFTSRTPVGSTPVLEHDDGRVVIESLIIAEYIDSLYPKNRLMPTDIFTKAQHQYHLQMCAQVSGAYYKVIRANEQTQQDANDAFSNAIQYFENHLNAPFFGGAKEGFVDYMIWPWFERIPVLESIGNYKFDTDRFPKLNTWIKQMLKLDAIKAVAHPQESLVAFVKGQIQDNPDYDIEFN